MPTPSPYTAPDGKLRCRWCGDAPEFLSYHDFEWGFPTGDDRELFEKLCLESFQSGLSWRTILAKREGFRAAFHQFDFDRIARCNQRDVERLLKDESIVRHRGKIEAVLNNARQAQAIVKQCGSLGAFFWQFEPRPNPQPNAGRKSEQTGSVALSKELKKLGWQFVGPTTVHAFMQAAGLLNDHVQECVIQAKASAARKRFQPPIR